MTDHDDDATPAVPVLPESRVILPTLETPTLTKAELAELLSDKTNRDILLNAQSAGEVLQLVQTWSPARRSMG